MLQVHYAKNYGIKLKTNNMRCKKILNYDTIVGHQAKCRYSPQVCPAAKLAVGNCSWTGRYNDIKGHLGENHLEESCEYVEGDFKFLCRLITNTTCIYFVFAYNEIFFFCYLKRKIIYFMLFFCMLVLLKMQLNINRKWSSLIKMIQKVFV